MTAHHIAYAAGSLILFVAAVGYLAIEISGNADKIIAALTGRKRR